jgi:YbbR domain-containing protein
MRAVPSEVRFTFEPRRTASVPVHARFIGDGRNGYAISSIAVEPTELEITGPRSRVARITAVVTDQIDVSTVTGVSAFHVNAFVNDPFVRFESSPDVTVTVTMKKQ